MVIAFVSDRLEWNCKFRVLNVIDDFECEVVALEVSRSSMLAEGGMLLEKTIWIHGKLQSITCDNSPEFISSKFRQRC